MKRKKKKKRQEGGGESFFPDPLFFPPHQQNNLRFLKKPIPQKNIFRKPESALKPRHTARILGGQNPKKKNVLSILEKIHPRENQKSKELFSFWGCRVKRGGGGGFVERTIQFRATTRSARAKSLPHFVLKIGSNLV